MHVQTSHSECWFINVNHQMAWHQTGTGDTAVYLYSKHTENRLVCESVLERQNCDNPELHTLQSYYITYDDIMIGNISTVISKKYAKTSCNSVKCI